ncbi:MAG: N-acetyl-D-Glu racemase DgcA [Hyphomicrobium sp.]
MANPKPQLVIEARHENWPLREAFNISRGSKTAADVIIATVTDGRHTGRGEAVPYARYGETVEASVRAIAALGPITRRDELAARLPPGAALNAVDCALWDYEAKSSGTAVHKLAGCAHLAPVVTAFTLSLDTPDAMAAKARAVPDLPLLKLKLGGIGDGARMRAVRAARPDARLIADANEAWSVAMLAELLAEAAALGFEVIEQPLPENADEALRGFARPLPVCADESVHTVRDLPRLVGLYDAINIKLDKAGGLTGELALHGAARDAGLKIMVGSMVATSLAIAPALILAQDAEWTDLDGPLLLARDRAEGVVITAGRIAPATATLWG